MGFTTTINPSALQADGAYVSLQIVPSQLPQGINTQLMEIVGAANWGPVNTPTYLSNYSSGTPIFGDTNVALNGSTDYGLMARVDVADAVASYFLAVRATDGTDAAATGTIVDNAAAVVIDLTGFHTGSLGDKIKYDLELQSGSGSAKPVYKFTVTPPYGNPEVFNNIVGYTSSAYAPATFKANFLAAINGTNGTPASKWVVASAGSSTVAPVVGSGSLSGGADGSSGMDDSDVLGTDGFAGSRTGMYALRGLSAGATLCLAGVDGSQADTFSAVNAFVQSESCIAVLDFPLNTDTETAIADRVSNSLSSTFIMLLEDWVKVNDPAGRGVQWQGPSGAGAGIVASVPPYLYPGNKPYDGMPTVFATESTIAVPIGVGSADAAARESNGINWIGNPIPRGNQFGLYHGMMSDGVTLCSDVRMGFYIALNIQQILGLYVGEMQTNAADDDTRAKARAAVNAFMNSLLPPNTQQIAAYEDTLDTSDNSPETVEQGIMLCKLEVETMSAVRFAVAAIQAGVGVTITIGPVQS